MCPHDYTYPPAAFDRPPEIITETLYVVGGLYGNLAALDAIEALAAREHNLPTIVFNGDFHWFDAEPAWFSEIDARVTLAIRGNVETEIARSADIGAGCGCAYPEKVGDDIVNRSNEILIELRRNSPAGAAARLRRLPMHMVARVGDLRIGIVHGDASALAGWRFAHDALDDPALRPWLADVGRTACIDLFASTHTCLAALRELRFPNGRLTVINNGAAGMPNFSGFRAGLLSRIAVTPTPHPQLYGLEREGVHIDAIPIDYDTDAFLARFLARWPQQSPAHASYFRRVVDGPDYDVAVARGAL